MTTKIRIAAAFATLAGLQACAKTETTVPAVTATAASAAPMEAAEETPAPAPAEANPTLLLVTCSEEGKAPSPRSIENSILLPASSVSITKNDGRTIIETSNGHTAKGYFSSCDVTAISLDANEVFVTNHAASLRIKCGGNLIKTGEGDVSTVNIVAARTPCTVTVLKQ